MEEGGWCQHPPMSRAIWPSTHERGGAGLHRNVSSLKHASANFDLLIVSVLNIWSAGLAFVQHIFLSPANERIPCSHFWWRDN